MFFQSIFFFPDGITSLFDFDLPKDSDRLRKPNANEKIIFKNITFNRTNNLVKPAEGFHFSL
jgi:hypothetical protein